MTEVAEQCQQAIASLHLPTRARDKIVCRFQVGRNCTITEKQRRAPSSSSMY